MAIVNPLAERTRKTKADCTVRALAHVAGLTYAAAEALAEEAGRSAGRGFRSAALIEQCKKTGIVFRKVRMGSRTLRRFLREHPTGRFYVRKRGHAFAVIDGAVSDSTKVGAIVLDAWQWVADPLAVSCSYEVA